MSTWAHTSRESGFDGRSVLPDMLDKDRVHWFHGVEQAGRHSTLPFLGAILHNREKSERRVTDGSHDTTFHTHNVVGNVIAIRIYFLMTEQLATVVAVVSVVEIGGSATAAASFFFSISFFIIILYSPSPPPPLSI